MPPAYRGKFRSTKLRHCPFCKSSFPTANSSNSKDADFKGKYHMIGRAGTHVEAGEPNDVRAKTVATDSGICAKYETPDMRTMCQCS